MRMSKMICATNEHVASIICVDLIIRQFPGKKNFKIQDSNTFLSTGLSLSFGVMVRMLWYSFKVIEVVS